MLSALKQRIRNQSCFWKVLSTIGVVAVSFQLITLSTLAHYMIVPLGQRAAEDLSSVIVHAAETWYELDAKSRESFTRVMLEKHKLLVTDNNDPLPDSTTWLPYLYFLKSSLSKEIGFEISLKQSLNDDNEQWFWVDVPVEGKDVRVGFSRPRIGVNPPVAFFLLLSVGALLTFITAAFLTRRITVPIEKLYKAAQEVGKGLWPAPIQEDGPRELAVLTREFNRMSIQVKDLLSNRTTLLAGIAHDLRTPLTQITLALEMLPDDGGNPVLMRSIREDLKKINSLIGESLSLGMLLQENSSRDSDLKNEIEEVIASVNDRGYEIRLKCKSNLVLNINALAFHRILNNLLINALRYGGGDPVDIECQQKEDRILIRVMDRGPGIPEHQREAVFRPFYRMEKSRGSKTGGSGLGLAIVRNLADENNWSVKLRSREGGGLIAELEIKAS